MTDTHSGMALLVAMLVLMAMLVVAGLSSYRIYGAQASQQHATLEPGKLYVVLWSCLAQIGCYGEVVRIEGPTAKDGWTPVSVCRARRDAPGPPSCEDAWRINLSQAIAVQPLATGPTRAAN